MGAVLESVRPIVDWLVNGAPGVSGSPALMKRLCDDLRAAGIPLDHAEAFVRTLHPHIVGRSFRWSSDGTSEVREQSWAYLQSRELAESPMGIVFQTGVEQRRAGVEGFTDFVAMPIRFLSGQIHAFTIATRRPEGFAEEHLAAMRRVVPPLSRIAEILALGRTAANLLDTYVGHNAGERILAGRIQRGEVEPIHAVLWFSDLRGFTALAAKLDPNALIRALNELFECQVPSIEKRGGEVLKFIGDGLLAIFPIREGGKSISALCDLALEAAEEAHEAQGALNTRRAAAGEPPLHFGLALHVGDVVYGNIGGSGRLDFTAIGPAVNLAARLEGLASHLGRRLVLSEAFATAARAATRKLGEFELKGVTGPQAAYGIEPDQ